MHSPRLALDKLTRPVWRVDASCRSTHAALFFAPSTVEPTQERRTREAHARALCRSCPVQPACRDYALDVQEPHGIWGGLTELERRRIVRWRLAERSATG